MIRSQAEPRKIIDPAGEQQFRPSPTQNEFEQVDNDARGSDRQEEKSRDRRISPHSTGKRPQASQPAAPVQRGKGEAKGRQVAIGQTQPPGQIEKCAEIGVAGMKEQRKRPVDEPDRDRDRNNRRGCGERQATRRPPEGSVAIRPCRLRAAAEPPIKPAERSRRKTVSLDNPPVKNRRRAIDEQAGEDDIRQKVGALSDAPEPDDSAN